MVVSRRPVVHTAAARTAARVVAIAFLVVGVLGFVPGITNGYGSLGLSGPDSQAQLLGLFQVSMLLNAVHLAFGVAGLLLSRSVPGAVCYLVVGGLVHLLLWAYGGTVATESEANVVSLDGADDWLHLTLGLVMIALGLLPRQRGSDPRRRE